MYSLHIFIFVYVCSCHYAFINNVYVNLMHYCHIPLYQHPSQDSNLMLEHAGRVFTHRLFVILYSLCASTGINKCLYIEI